MRRGVSAAPQCPWHLRQAPAGRPTTLTTGQGLRGAPLTLWGACQVALRKFVRPCQKATQSGRGQPPRPRLCQALPTHRFAPGARPNAPPTSRCPLCADVPAAREGTR